MVPGLLATSVLVLTGLKQLTAFKNGEVRDLQAWLLALAGLVLSVAVVVLGLIENGGRPTTGLMGTLLGALLMVVVMATSLKQPVNALLIGIAPLTGLFTAIAATFNTPSDLALIDSKTLFHVITSIVAYGAVAFAGALSILVQWHHQKLKGNPMTPLLSTLPPLDAMELLFLRAVQTAWLTLTVSLVSGVLYIDNFWAQNLAHKTALSGLAWLGMSLTLWQHIIQGGVTPTMRKTAIVAAVLLCIGYLGSKAILEFIL
jgi:ABC-type uncharacterized transport system permease subunit